jgi:hypothetical protein
LTAAISDAKMALSGACQAFGQHCWAPGTHSHHD